MKTNNRKQMTWDECCLQLFNASLNPNYTDEMGLAIYHNNGFPRRYERKWSKKPLKQKLKYLNRCIARGREISETAKPIKMQTIPSIESLMRVNATNTSSNTQEQKETLDLLGEIISSNMSTEAMGKVVYMVAKSINS